MVGCIGDGFSPLLVSRFRMEDGLSFDTLEGCSIDW